MPIKELDRKYVHKHIDSVFDSYLHSLRGATVEALGKETEVSKQIVESKSSKVSESRIPNEASTLVQTPHSFCINCKDKPHKLLINFKDEIICSNCGYIHAQGLDKLSGTLDSSSVVLYNPSREICTCGHKKEMHTIIDTLNTNFKPCMGTFNGNDCSEECQEFHVLEGNDKDD